MVVFLAVRPDAGYLFDSNQTGPSDDQSWGAMPGNYQLPNGKLVGIDLFRGDDGKLSLLYADYRSGVVRRLFPMDSDRFAMGPGFAVASPPELIVRVVRERGDIASIAMRRPRDRETIAPRVPLQLHEVSFTSSEATLAGTLLVPPGNGPHPAVILLHGSGPLTRWSFGPYPHFFTSLGFAVLIYDKRGAGASTGAFARTVPYPELQLRDAVEAVRFLETRHDIDEKHIGLWGASEGGMLTTQVAARLKSVAFVINSSGFMMPLWQQILYNIEAQLRTAGFSASEVAAAVDFQKSAFKVMQTGEGWDQFAKAQVAARQQKWWAAYFGSDTGYASLAGMQSRWDRVYSFDPLPALKSVTCPVLGVFGALDISTPARITADNMRRSLTEGGNRNVTIKIFERGNHPLMEAHTGGTAEIPTLKRQVPGLFDTLASWLLKQVHVIES